MKKTSNSAPATKKGLEQLQNSIKKEFKNYPTKSDLKKALENHPTKTDLRKSLENYPTKTDLKKALENHPTKTDLAFELKNLKEEIREEFNAHTSKIINAIDPILKEVKASREEREILSAKQRNHEDRISHVEEVLDIVPSSE